MNAFVQKSENLKFSCEVGSVAGASPCGAKGDAHETTTQIF